VCSLRLTRVHARMLKAEATSVCRVPDPEVSASRHGQPRLDHPA
jgi:hypothetical protein